MAKPAAGSAYGKGLVAPHYMENSVVEKAVFNTPQTFAFSAKITCHALTGSCPLMTRATVVPRTGRIWIARRGGVAHILHTAGY